jgi:ankyrin repeat protein
VDSVGTTLLHKAAREGNVAVVRHLISQGLNVNVRDKSGFTPLHSAASGGRTEVARYLVSQGANVNVKDTIFGHTPLDSAKLGHHTETARYFESIGGTAPGIATLENNASRVKTPLEQAVDAVLANDRSRWNTLRNQNRFASDFVNAGEQVFRNRGNFANLQRFVQIQERHTGNAIQVTPPMR